MTKACRHRHRSLCCSRRHDGESYFKQRKNKKHLNKYFLDRFLRALLKHLFKAFSKNTLCLESAFQCERPSFRYYHVGRAPWKKAFPTFFLCKSLIKVSALQVLQIAFRDALANRDFELI